MLGETKSVMLTGMQGIIVSVECDISNGLPGFQMVGYLSSEVKEGKERILSAIRNSGYKIPANKITINLTPACLHKNGTGFDLAIAIALATAAGMIHCNYLEEMVMIGEINLTGRIQGVRGVLPMVLEAKQRGYRYCLVPEDNYEEAVLVEGLEILGVHDLKQVLQLLSHKKPDEMRKDCKNIKNTVNREKHRTKNQKKIPDFSEIKGQYMLKRCCEVAASGMHNLLMVGPPGVGKSLMAEAILGILPKLTKQEQLEVTSIYSICGLADERISLLESRPFRNPHHKVTPRGMIGGGQPIRPGEISLANHGVLFLDEFAEFSTQTIEALRQPMEKKQVCITRTSGTVVFPADFALILAMNPCPCGYYPDTKRCNCSPLEIKRYIGKVSGPMLDRMDMSIQVGEIAYEELNGKEQLETSESIRRRVEFVHAIQKERFANDGILFNAQMTNEQIMKHCVLTKELQEYMQEIYQNMHLSPRGYHKILKVARTLSDMNGHINIGRNELDEAIIYRSWRM